MTWPDGIAAATLLAFAYLITRDQHRSTTHTQHTRRTENGHDRSHTRRQQDH